jgi:hypothetical protein
MAVTPFRGNPTRPCLSLPFPDNGAHSPELNLNRRDFSYFVYVLGDFKVIELLAVMKFNQGLTPVP